MKRRQRSWLFTPGDNPRHLAKLADGICDVSLIDLEDSVAAARKADAHRLIERILHEEPRSHPLWVRINPLRSVWLGDDIACAMAADGICVPKIERPDDLTELENLLQHHERRTGKQPGSTRLLIAIESPRALISAYDIATCNARIAGLLFGAEDYALAMELPRTALTTENALIFAQCQVVVAAKAAGIDAIAGVSTSVTDHEGHRAHCVKARELGFTGVAAIHPDQVPVINAVFRPSERDVDEARNIVAAYDSGLKRGQGVITLDGAMIDYPIAARAARMLAEEGTSTPPEWLDNANR